MGLPSIAPAHRYVRVSPNKRSPNDRSTLVLKTTEFIAVLLHDQVTGATIEVWRSNLALPGYFYYVDCPAEYQVFHRGQPVRPGAVIPIGKREHDRVIILHPATNSQIEIGRYKGARLFYLASLRYRVGRRNLITGVVSGNCAAGKEAVK